MRSSPETLPPARLVDDEPDDLFALMVVSAVGRSHQGRKRTRNEDRFLLLERHNLYVVADGMGGYVGGQVAAQQAIDTIELAFDRGEDPAGPVDEPRAAAVLRAAYEEASRSVFERSVADPALHGMATTLVGACFLPRRARAWVAHVGDSRCYRLRRGALEQLTVDHAEAGGLTRGIGAGPEVEVEVSRLDLEIGDRYLLCSDGLTKMVPDTQIQRLLVGHADPDEAADALIRRANARGGKDNVTVVVVSVRAPGVGVVPHDRDVEEALIREARARVVAATRGPVDGG